MGLIKNRSLYTGAHLSCAELGSLETLLICSWSSTRVSEEKLQVSQSFSGIAFFSLLLRVLEEQVTDVLPT